LNQEGINNLNRSIPSKDVETVKKNLPTKNRLVPAGFTADFYQTFKEELTPMLFKLYHKIERGNTNKLIL
jgi:hypothetical protein